MKNSSEYQIKEETLSKQIKYSFLILAGVLDVSC